MMRYVLRDFFDAGRQSRRAAMLTLPILLVPGPSRSAKFESPSSWERTLRSFDRT
jgi:hypothetical protein